MVGGGGGRNHYIGWRAGLRQRGRGEAEHAERQPDQQNKLCANRQACDFHRTHESLLELSDQYTPSHPLTQPPAAGN